MFWTGLKSYFIGRNLNLVEKIGLLTANMFGYNAVENNIWEFCHLKI